MTSTNTKSPYLVQAMIKGTWETIDITTRTEANKTRFMYASFQIVTAA